MKQLYTQFRAQRIAFRNAIRDIPDKSTCEQFTALMLYRLMLLYFLQSAYMLDNNPNYLLHQLYAIQHTHGPDNFYRQFLLPLLHHGYVPHVHSTHSARFAAVLAQLPRIDEDLFMLHAFEQQHPALLIPDHAFITIFTFFNNYQWQLNDQIVNTEQIITPNTLDYLFERHSSELHIGAYYTKEDITGYIAAHTIIPYLFEHTHQTCPTALQAGSPVWQLLKEQPERYIYEPVCTTARLSQESTHEYQARQQRAQRLYALLSAGAINSIDDIITHNLDIVQFAHDALTQTDIPELRSSFLAQLQKLAVLDPTCGSGDFLIAALKVLVPLYAACETHLTQYDIVKTSISKNVYGIDILPEATTVCKLRLFLTLLSQADKDTLEALPELRQNIRTGNTLRDGEDKQALYWSNIFHHIPQHGGFSVVIGNPPYVEYDERHIPYTLTGFATHSCGNLYPCIVERSYHLLAAHGYCGMILPLAAFATRNMLPFIEHFKQWFPRSWLSFYHFRPAMLFSGDNVASIPTSIFLARKRTPNIQAHEQRFSTHLMKWRAEQRPHLFPLLSYTGITAPLDTANRHYYPKFGTPLENTILEKILRHPTIEHHLTTHNNENSMYYRSAGGLYWKVFINFPWPYVTTSNKCCSFQEAYHRDIFVALFNSSLFWWYYTVTFDTFNLKNYMLFGFRFSYPDNQHTLDRLKALCQQLMAHFQAHAQHRKRGNTGSYTIYARHAKPLIDQIDHILAEHYGLTNEERDFIVSYDIKYRMGKHEGT